MASASALSVVIVGISGLVVGRFVDLAKITWVIQNPSICYTIVEYGNWQHHRNKKVAF